LFVFESTLVAALAGVVGLGFAMWTVSLVPKLVGENLPLPKEVSCSGRCSPSRWASRCSRAADGLVSGVAKLAR
jgi:hypothetical protein